MSTGNDIHKTTVGTVVEIDPNWWKVWKNRRYVLSVMACFGMMNMYATRINLSVAIVAMTELKNVTNDFGETIEVSEFDWSSTQRGYLLSSFYYGYVVMQLPAGMLLKKVSGHIAFGVGTFVPGLITLFTPLLAKHTSFVVLLSSRIVMGIFQAAAVPSILSFWITWAPPLERARLHGIAISGAFIGTVITMPLAGYVGQVFGWQSIFYVFGTLVCVWYVAWLFLIRENPDKDPFISEKERKYIQRAIGEKKDANEPPPPVPWMKIFLSLPVWAVFVAGFSWGWGYVTMLTQLPSYLKASVGFDLAANGALSALPYLTMYLMSLLAGYLADIFLVKKILTVTQVRKYFISIALTLQMVFILVAAYLESMPVLNIFCISLGIGFGAFTYSGVGINYVDLAPRFGPIIGGMGNTFATVCGILSPILTGFIVYSEAGTEEVKREWRLVFYIAAGIYAVGAVVYWFLGSAEEQEWAKEKKTDQKRENDNSYDNPTFRNSVDDA